jgi:hypothetical protein
MLAADMPTVHREPAGSKPDRCGALTRRREVIVDGQEKAPPVRAGLQGASIENSIS